MFSFKVISICCTLLACARWSHAINTIDRAVLIANGQPVSLKDVADLTSSSSGTQNNMDNPSTSSDIANKPAAPIEPLPVSEDTSSTIVKVDKSSTSDAPTPIIPSDVNVAAMTKVVDAALIIQEPVPLSEDASLGIMTVDKSLTSETSETIPSIIVAPVTTKVVDTVSTIQEQVPLSEDASSVVVTVDASDALESIPSGKVTAVMTKLADTASTIQEPVPLSEDSLATSNVIDQTIELSVPIAQTVDLTSGSLESVPSIESKADVVKNTAEPISISSDKVTPQSDQTDIGLKPISQSVDSTVKTESQQTSVLKLTPAENAASQTETGGNARISLQPISVTGNAESKTSSRLYLTQITSENDVVNTRIALEPKPLTKPSASSNNAVDMSLVFVDPVPVAEDMTKDGTLDKTMTRSETAPIPTSEYSAVPLVKAAEVVKSDDVNSLVANIRSTNPTDVINKIVTNIQSAPSENVKKMVERVQTDPGAVINTVLDRIQSVSNDNGIQIDNVIKVDATLTENTASNTNTRETVADSSKLTVVDRPISANYPMIRTVGDKGEIRMRNVTGTKLELLYAKPAPPGVIAQRRMTDSFEEMIVAAPVTSSPETTPTTSNKPETVANPTKLTKDKPISASYPFIRTVGANGEERMRNVSGTKLELLYAKPAPPGVIAQRRMTFSFKDMIVDQPTTNSPDTTPTIYIKSGGISLPAIAPIMKSPSIDSSVTSGSANTAVVGMSNNEVIDLSLIKTGVSDGSSETAAGALVKQSSSVVKVSSSDTSPSSNDPVPIAEGPVFTTPVQVTQSDTKSTQDNFKTVNTVNRLHVTNLSTGAVAGSAATSSDSKRVTLADRGTLIDLSANTVTTSKPRCLNLCQSPCQYGRKLDRNGCETCECNFSPDCPTAVPASEMLCSTLRRASIGCFSDADCPRRRTCCVGSCGPMCRRLTSRRSRLLSMFRGQS